MVIVMKQWIGLSILVFVITIGCFLIVKDRANYAIFESNSDYEEKIVLVDEEEVSIKVNNNFLDYNSSERNNDIEYIVIHYTGTVNDAESIIYGYNHYSSGNASADFFISHEGDIYQYNPDIDNRYSWAVGGDKKENKGGKLFGVVNNSNSISVELCVKNDGDTLANSDDWYFTDETLNSAKLLIRYLMMEYDIDIDHVVRHYDVSGKLCPGVKGWNDDSDSVEEWTSFKKSLLY